MRLPYITCPSSGQPAVTAHPVPVPQQGTYGSTVSIQNAEYVVISGHTRNPNSQANLYTAGAYGFYATNGTIYYNSRNGMRDLVDGTSNTLVVSESSRQVKDVLGNGSGGTVNTMYDMRQGAYSGGMWVATTGGPTNWATNSNSVRFPINSNLMTATDAEGFRQRYTHNNPLSSYHSGGVQGVLADGSVRFLSESMSEVTLQRLSIRNDGLVLGEF